MKYLEEPGRYKALAGRMFIPLATPTTAATLPPTQSPTKAGIENANTTNPLGTNARSRMVLLQAKTGNKKASGPIVGLKEDASDPKARAILHPATTKSSKTSSFSEEDLKILIKFLKKQPTGPILWHVFQKLAKQVGVSCLIIIICCANTIGFLCVL